MHGKRLFSRGSGTGVLLLALGMAASLAPGMAGPLAPVGIFLPGPIQEEEAEPVISTEEPERPYGMPAPEEGMRSGLMRLQERFENGAPAPGEPFPNLTVYDSDGNKIKMKQVVRDHTTVVILGCLT